MNGIIGIKNAYRHDVKTSVVSVSRGKGRQN